MEHGAIFQALQQKGANLGHKDNKGRSTMYYASVNKKTDKDVKRILFSHWMEMEKKKSD